MPEAALGNNAPFPRDAAITRGGTRWEFSDWQEGAAGCRGQAAGAVFCHEAWGASGQSLGDL